MKALYLLIRWLYALPGVKPVLWLACGASIAFMISDARLLERSVVPPPRDPDCVALSADQPETSDASASRKAAVELTVPQMVAADGRRPVSYTFFLPSAALVMLFILFELLCWMNVQRKKLLDRYIGWERKRLHGARERLQRWHAAARAKLREDEAKLEQRVAARVLQEVARYRAEDLEGTKRARQQAETDADAARLLLTGVQEREARLVTLESREASVTRREAQVVRAEAAVNKTRSCVATLVLRNEALVARLDAACEYIGDALIDCLLQSPHAIRRLFRDPALHSLLANGSAA